MRSVYWLTGNVIECWSAQRVPLVVSMIFFSYIYFIDFHSQFVQIGKFYIRGKKKNIQIANDEVLKHIARRRNGKFNFVFFRLNQTIWHRLLFYCCADQKLRYGIPIRWSAHRTHTHSVAHVDHQHHGNCVMCVCVKRDGSNAVGHGTRMGLGHARCLSLFIFRTSIIAWKPKSQAAQN